MNLAFAPVFAALHAQAFPQHPWDAASFTSLLAQPGMLGYLDDRGGFLLLRLVQDEAEIITLGAVLPRQGIATALLHQGLAALRARGVKVIHLEVASDNEAGRALYEKFGFALTGRRKSYYENGADALTLALQLG